MKIKRFDDFVNESKGIKDEEWLARFGEKKTYVELKDKFEVGETISVTRVDRNGHYDQDCVIEDIFFEEMEGHWVAKLDNNTIRSLNQLRKK